MMFSVIIPTHNRAPLLREAIESALGQEPCGTEAEVIVVDDDSTDDTPTVVASYPSVRYVRTRQGQAGGSRNAGVVAARGDWLAFLDDDDVWLPHKLRVCRQIMRTHPDAQFIYSAATICDHELRPGATWAGPDLGGGRSPVDAFLDVVISASVVVMRREVFVAAGGFDTSVPRAEDLDLWVRAAALGVRCVGTDEPLVLYRGRPRADGAQAYRSYRDTMTVLRRFFGPSNKARPPWPRRQRILLRYRGWYAYQLIVAARQAEREGQGARAAHFRRAAFGISPPHAIKSLLT